ncbi:MAG: hypothetical protein IPJ65_28535 [Archangiaceae bacterium]|nr:hypothetical protein [Archangiaceae bacterium]
MLALAIVDDRKSMRTTVQRQIEALVAGRFSVTEHDPLPSPLDYPSWVIDEDVSALIIDERLNEQKGAGGKHVSYTGHEVVDELRKAHDGLPIFVLTSYSSDDALVARIDRVNVVMDRRTFLSKPAPHVTRIMRDAELFADARDAQLLELGQLAEAIAGGSASPKQKKQAKLLQAKLNIHLPIKDITERADWLAKAEEQLAKLKRARQVAAASASKGKGKQR